MNISTLRYLCTLCTITFLFQSCDSSTKDIEEIATYKGKKKSLTETDVFLQNQMETLGIPALSIAIINDGEIAYHKAFGVSNTTTNQAIDENSIFEAASLSKPVQAFFVLKLSEKGIIDIDRPLYFYLPDADMEIDQRYKNITARTVLSHQTGFPNWRWFDTPPEGLDINRGDFFMLNDPGTAFSYSGEAYAYLLRVIAHLNFINMYEMSDLFEQEVALPLNMRHAYTVWDDHLYDHKVFGHVEGAPKKRNWKAGLPSHNSKVFGGLHTEANSYAHFLTSIIKGEGLYPETFQEMLSPHTEMPKDNVNYTEDGITHWSMGFGIKPIMNDTIYRHGGSNKGYQSEIAFSVNKKYGYVFFVNCEKGNELNEQLEQFLEMGVN